MVAALGAAGAGCSAARAPAAPPPVVIVRVPPPEVIVQPAPRSIWADTWAAFPPLAGSSR